MRTPHNSIRVPTRLTVLAAAGLMLEQLERHPRKTRADAQQYQQLIRKLGPLLDQAENDPALTILLNQLPALSELHENRHYAHAGLCRSPLDAAIESERHARALLERLRHPQRPSH
jgi:hypothetical protein